MTFLQRPLAPFVTRSSNSFPRLLRVSTRPPLRHALQLPAVVIASLGGSQNFRGRLPLIL